MDYNKIYNEEYYRTSCGDIPYECADKWMPYMIEKAERIIGDFNPKTVLDVGCAMGYLVEALRDRGVEAYGIDVSEYAINHARCDIKPYLRAMSITNKLPDDMPQKYDLIVNIEVLEHLYEDDGIIALQNMTKYSDRIIFSSTAEDITEPTHLNVQQVEYWAEKFAKMGFYKNLLYKTDYISKYSGLYENKNIEVSRIVRNYEQFLRLLNLKYEDEQRTSGKLATDIETLRNQIEVDKNYYEEEINRLTEEVKASIEKEKSLTEKILLTSTNNKDLHEINQKLNNEIKQLEYEIDELKRINDEISAAEEKISNKYTAILRERDELREYISALQNQNSLFDQERKLYFTEKENLRVEKEKLLNSRGYRLLLQLYKVESKIIPIGSNRRKLLKFLLKKPIKSILKLRRKFKENITSDIPKEIQQEQKTSFYSPSEIERQEWCKNHPINEEIKFSFVVPLYNTPINLLIELIESVKNQFYKNWELCLVNASGDKTEIDKFIQSNCISDNRIIYKKLNTNLGISGNTIEAIKISSGEFVVLLDHDDLIAPNALYEYANCLIENPNIDFFYSDKDMINEAGTLRINPLYKPEYSPEIMYSANYFTHLCAIRKSILDKTTGYDKETDGAQDWDIFLKVMEQTTSIKRVPQKLYHWRIISSSVASGISAKPYVLDAQLKAINNYIKRKGWAGKIYFENREKSILKVDWEFRNNPSKYVIYLSNSGNEKLNICGDYNSICLAKSDIKSVDQLVAATTSDVIFFIDCDECIKVSDNLLNELSAWAVHPEIGFVSPLIYQDKVIKSCGLVYDENEIMDLFYNKPLDYYGEIGGALWYRNLSILRQTCIAIERVKYVDYCKTNADLRLLAIACNCFKLIDCNFRNVYDCFAKVEVTDKFTNIDLINLEFDRIKSIFRIPKDDTYFNNSVTLDVERRKIAVNTQIVNAADMDKYTSDALFLSGFYDFSEDEIIANRNIVMNKYNGPVKTMVWFLPEFDYAFYAGLYTIFRTADYLQRVHGIKHTFAFLSGLDSDIMMARIGSAFPELGKCRGYCLSNDKQIKRLGNYDASVCTLWTTAFYSLKMNNVRKKFYFIQDYEPLFYPGGSTYAQAEATYRFGFKGIANTKGLKYVYENEFGGEAEALDPSIDTNIFYPNKNREFHDGPYTLFFYGRPGHPRNGFELGVNALKILKQQMGNRIRIITAGANYDINAYGLNGILENLGRLKVEDTGDLYRQCDAGLVMMFTRHPSYLPYEMMACGCAVVSNYNAYTTWFLKNDENCVVTEASASSIAGAIQDVLLDKERRKRISENASKQIIENNPDWDISLEKIANFII